MVWKKVSFEIETNVSDNGVLHDIIVYAIMRGIGAELTEGFYVGEIRNIKVKDKS